MSVWNLFRRNSQPAQPTQEEKSQKVNDSICQLRKTIEMHEKRQVHLQKLANAEQEKAKAALKKRDRKGAMTALKKKKRYETSIQSTDAKILNLQTQILALEEALMNSETLGAMVSARDAMGKLMNEDTLEDAQTLADDMADAQDILKDLSDTLSQPMGMFADMDDDELMQELDELEELDIDLEEIEEERPLVSKAKRQTVVDEALPDVLVSPPSKPIVKEELTDEDARDLKELDRLELVMSAQVAVGNPAACAKDQDVENVPVAQLVGVSQ